MKYFSNMASPMGLFCTCFLVNIVLSLIMAANTGGRVLASGGRVFKVGGEMGWKQPGVNNSSVYTLWATRNRFQVGDSLAFEYEYRKDSVIEVDKWGYYHCNATQSIVAFNNGNSVFKLDRPGPFYFISGTLDHCKNGQRLLVEVMGIHHHHHDSHPHSPVPPPEYSYLAPSPDQAYPRTSSASVLASVKLVGFVPILVSAAFCLFAIS